MSKTDSTNRNAQETNGEGAVELHQSNWKEFQFADLFEVSSGDRAPHKDDSGVGYPVYGSNGPIGWTENFNYADGYLVGRVGAAGAVNRVYGRVWASDNTLTVDSRDEKLNFKFAWHLLNQLDIKSLATENAQPLITQTNLKAMTATVPPLPQQRRIADILDTVDRAIRKTEEVIDKLEQMKRGLLHDLLTRGIDANGELRDPDAHPEQFKDSELGRIPKEWEVAQLRRCVGLKVGFAFKSDWYTETQGIRLLRGANVGTGTPDWSDERRLPFEVAQEFPGYRLSEGDIVIGMDRPFVGNGFKVSVLSEHDVPALLVQRVGCFECHSMSRRYASYVIKSSMYKRQLKKLQAGMDIPHISKAQILTCKVPVPPDEEQRRIEQKIDGLNDILAKERRMHRNLKKCKGGISSDLISGV